MQNNGNTLHELRMKEALKLAKQAYDEDEVPVGAVIVFEKKIIARAYNQVERLKDPTAHAEMIAITQAADALSSKWLYNCEMYVTLEPCSMCAGALVLSRMKHLYFSAKDPKTGACGSVTNIVNQKGLNHSLTVSDGILRKQSSALLQKFFMEKRNARSSALN